MMASGSFLFRLRGLWFGLIFWAGFSLYSIHRQNIIEELSRGAQSRFRWNQDATASALLGLMGVCAVAAALIRTWASAYLSAGVVHDARLHSERLVADGPYRHVRNPLYLGTLLIAVAFALMASWLGFVVIIVGISALTLALVATEEAGLRASQGEQYRGYLEAVPRLLPSLGPRLPSSGCRPNWANGIRGELYMWSFAAGLVAFAVTRKLWLFYAGATVGVVVLTIEGVVASLKSKPTGNL
jgi:protein-S-isoprenylcysteine O-methyltransferase Ste14